MKTPIHLNSKGNEVIAWCSFDVRSCFLLSSHCCYMCCRHQCLLHHICVSQVNNDEVYQNTKINSSNKNIHSLSSVSKEKVGDLPLNMCSTFQNNSCNNISKCIMGYCTLTPIATLKQMGT